MIEQRRSEEASILTKQGSAQESRNPTREACGVRSACCRFRTGKEPANHAKHTKRHSRSCRSRVASGLIPQSESGSKLTALQTLREMRTPDKSSHLLSVLASSLLFCWLALGAGAEEVFIRANQIGYRSQDVKIGVAFAKSPLPDAFAVVAADTEQVRFEGKAKPIGGVKWGQFDNHAEVDFSAFKTPGRYVLRVGQSQSLPFTISPTAYGELPDELLEFMREQRCGYNPWLDAVCHPFDGRTAYGPLTNGTYLDARGGWHDAADLLKYLLTSGNATAQLLLAYELSPKSKVQSPKSESGSPQSTVHNPEAPGGIFADRVNALGQAGGNGIPDVSR